MILLYFVALSYSINSGLCATDFNYVDSAMDKIGLEVNPRMIVAFTFNNPNYSINDNLIISKITQRFPLLLLNMDEKLETCKFSKLLESPRKYSIFIIILRNNLNNTRKMQEIIEIMISPAPKPRLLAISVDEKAWDMNIFKNILLYGWKKKYLDFTILGKDKDNNLTIMFYNPFTKIFYNETYKSTTTIFPDKLNDMNGYSLKLPLWNAPPFILYNVSHSSVKVVSDDYDAFVGICEKLNCTLNPVAIGSRNENISINLLSSLEKNMYRFLVTGIFRKRYGKKKILSGMDYDYVKLIFLVPKLAVSEFSVPNIFGPLFRATVFIISFIYLAKFLKFPKRFWNFMNLFNILLGNQVRFSPTSFLQKIFYLMIVFSAIGITAEFLTPTKIQIINKGTLDSLEKISKSDMPLFATSQLYIDLYLQMFNNTEMNYTFNNRIPMLKLSAKDCVEELLMRKTGICITTDFEGKYFAKQYLDKDGQSRLEIIDLNLFGSLVTYPYEKSSPIIEKFDIVMRRFWEAQINKHLRYLKFKPENSESTSLYDEIKDQLTVQRFLIILFSGYIMAIISLFSEILIYKYLKK